MKAGEQRAPGGYCGVRTPSTLLLATILIAVHCLISNVDGEHGQRYFLKSNDKEILDFLLHESTYDKRIRPLSDGGPVVVNISVLLFSLSSPDESSLKYEVEFLLHQQWVDPRLKHDDAHRYSYLSGLHHMDDIWVPDFYFIKLGDFKESHGKEPLALQIYRNGTVLYSTKHHLILSCQGDLNIFPFDDPACTFSIESMAYEEKDLLIRWKNVTMKPYANGLAKATHFKEMNAYLIASKTSHCNKSVPDWRDAFSCQRVDLKFSRDDSFYFSTVFIPSIILVTSSFITFWLEWNAVPARVMIGVTTMLNFFTTSNSFRSTLPVVSNLAAMNLWDSVCMFFIYVSLLEFVAVNYVGRKRPKDNMAYMPGENAVIQVLAEKGHRIPQAIHRIGLSLVSGWVGFTGGGHTTDVGMTHVENKMERKRNVESSEGGTGLSGSGQDELSPPNRNSHDLVSCANCGNSQCSHSNAANNCPNGEELNEISQVEYTFTKRRNNDATHPIRVAKSIDVISRVVFPLGYSIFLLYFFGTYKGFDWQNNTLT